MKRALALAVSATAVLGLAGAAISTSGDPWKELRRPLQIPRIAPGSTCPASEPETNVDFGSYGVGQGYGPGPAYPIFGRRASLVFEYPPPRGSVLSGRAWGGQKVLWFLLPAHGDRVLIRGRQLDGPYHVRFGLDDVRYGRAGPPSAEMGLVVSGDRYDFPSTTRLRTGGCYGYQIDGPNYSRVIVFEAQLKCLAARISGNRVKAGPFTGLITRPYDVVEGRFRLHVGPYRDRAAGISQKIPWFVPRKHRVASRLVVRGTRLAPPRGTFRQFFPEVSASHSPERHVFASTISPPSSGCWRLTLRTGKVTGSVNVWVDG